MANEHRLRWNAPTQRTDGSALSAADIAGYTVTIDGTVHITVPGAAGVADLSNDAAFKSLKSGEHTLTVQAIDKNGVASSPSAPVTLTVVAPPAAPSGIALA